MLEEGVNAYRLCKNKIQILTFVEIAKCYFLSFKAYPCTAGPK